jgi:hypothetical protein
VSINRTLLAIIGQGLGCQPTFRGSNDPLGWGSVVCVLLGANAPNAREGADCGGTWGFDRMVLGICRFGED